MNRCFHCGSNFPKNFDVIWAVTPKQKEPVCCLGCKGVTEHIYSNGLGSYYEFRSELAAKPEDNNASSQFAMYDDTDYVQLIANELPNNQFEITLSLDNIHCAACAWLIEQAVQPINGLIKVNVNTVNQRATIVWDNKLAKLSEIFSRLNRIGYPATPFKVSSTETNIKKQEKEYVKRLGVAGIFTMQVMMIAVAMYFGAFTNMEPHQFGYFKWVSLALSIPVIFYSAVPFLTGAITALKAKRLNMDVPVSVAIYGAFTASFYQLVTTELTDPKGEVFFESISMFTFLLLIGKYLEFRAKSKAILSNVNLTSTLPITSTIISADNTEKQKLLKDIKVDDLVLVKAGQQIPVDGVIVEGQTLVSESLLTGEFDPQVKSVGDHVMAGSTNTDGLIKVKTTAIGAETTLANINKMQQSFADFKPKYSLLADKIAHWFVLAQLVISTLTYVGWYFVSPDDALWISLAVLVATCPCALSLATPTAYTCVLSTLSKNGILIKDSESFDRINTINRVGFDKTGTLTNGQFSIEKELWYEENLKGLSLSKTELQLLIVQLEKLSEHPIAKAFNHKHWPHIQSTSLPIQINNPKIIVGNGITAEITLPSGDLVDLAIGNAQHCKTTHTGANVYVSIIKEQQSILIAKFNLADQVKNGTTALLQYLRSLNLKLVMLTGDKSENVAKTASELQLDDVHLGCKPEQKAALVQSYQNKGDAVMMFGDGVNDAPVFAAADVSVAMGSGADISKQSASIIIVKDQLHTVSKLFEYAHKTKRIIKQNLLWSLIYNISILPVAMLGFVPPYIAVIGMSASSIIVVTNSLRLLK